MIDRRPIIGVMGSHEKEWAELAHMTGTLIAEFGYHLLTGAGGGVMTAVAKAFTEVDEREGLSLGTIPVADYKGGLVSHKEYPNPYIEIPLIVPLDKRAEGDSNPYSRNRVNIMSSSAVIIMPGEHGTQNEAALAIQYKKPTVFFGPEDIFEKFPALPTRVQDKQELCEFLEQVRRKFRSDEESQ